MHHLLDIFYSNHFKSFFFVTLIEISDDDDDYDYDYGDADKFFDPEVGEVRPENTSDKSHPSSMTAAQNDDISADLQPPAPGTEHIVHNPSPNESN